MNLSIERIRQDISDKLVLREGDTVNLHFKFPDGEIVTFESVPFDKLLVNIQPFRKERVNGFDHTLFIEDDNDFDQLETL